MTNEIFYMDHLVMNNTGPQEISWSAALADLPANGPPVFVGASAMNDSTGFAAAAAPGNSGAVISGTPPSPWAKTRLWTEAEGAEALELLAAGKTFGVVAARFGISRNAAIGRVHRMQDRGDAPKWVRVKTPGEKRQQAQKAAQKRWGEAGYRPAPLPRLDAPAVRIDAFAEGYKGQTGRVTIHELTEAHCKFPIDQPAPELVKYCGLVRAEGSPYCPDHYLRVCRQD